MTDNDKDFSKEENLKRFKAGKRLAKEKKISLQEALDITMNDRYNIETGKYIGSSKKIKELLSKNSTLLTGRK
tara:strand:+ start:284 stop:502 length:219 start_codon:yes stop_codon:yes gene_type:complete